MKYLKKKGDPDTCYHVWTEALAARDDMFDFIPANMTLGVTLQVPVIEEEVEKEVVVNAKKLPGRPRI